MPNVYEAVIEIPMGTKNKYEIDCIAGNLKIEVKAGKPYRKYPRSVIVLEEEDIPIINQYEELLTKQLEKFIQPNIPGLDGEISMDIKLAKVEMERAKVAIQIFDTVNRITEYLIKNCRGVMA